MTHSFFIRAVFQWLPLAVAITGVIGAIDLAVQQDFRQGANDPQIQMAEDAAAQLAGGASAVSVVPNDSINIATSLAPFIMVFDTQGDLVVGNAALSGAAPALPTGVFNTSAWTAPVAGHHLTWMTPPNENRFTWQPEADVRAAVVLVHYDGGYVAAGRSLREVEKREDQLTTNMFIVWLVTMAASLCASLFVSWFGFRRGL